MSDAPLTGVILAAGRAARLLPLTKRMPKACVQVGGKALIEYAVQSLQGAGVGQIIVVTGDGSQHIQSILGDGDRFGVPIRYVGQGDAPGTAHALLAAAPLIEGEAIVCYANAWTNETSFQPLGKCHPTTLLLGLAHSKYLQGIPKMSGGKVKGLDVQDARPLSDKVFTGAMRIDQTFLARLPDIAEEGAIDAALDRYCQEEEVRAVMVEGPWHTVDDAWSLLAVSEQALDAQANGDAHQHVHESAHIAPTARLIPPVTIGEGSSVHDFAVVGPYVTIGRNSVVGSHSEVRSSAVGDNCLIDSRATMRGCILDDGVELGPGFICIEELDEKGARGAVIGADHTVRPATLLPGGTILGGAD